jgi:hypothetical protein
LVRREALVEPAVRGPGSHHPLVAQKANEVMRIACRTHEYLSCTKMLATLWAQDGESANLKGRGAGGG